MEAGANPYKSLGLDAIFQYTGSGVQLFSGMVFYLIVVRLFDTTGVGAIALFVAIIGLFNIIFTFGLNAAAQHFTSFSMGMGDYPSVRRTIYKIIGFGFALSIIGLVTLVILAPEISVVFLHSASYTRLVRILSIVLFGNVMYGILNGTLLGIQNFRLSAIINIVIWVTYYMGAIALAIFSRSIDTVVIGWTIGIFLGVTVELAAVLWTVRKYIGGGRAPSNMFLLSYSFPILMSGLISYGAASADRFVVSGLLPLSSLGVYNFSLLIASSITFIAIPFNNILMPKFSEMFGRGRKADIVPTSAVASTLLSSFYVPAAVGIAALAPDILDLLGGNVYVIGSVPLRIIMFSTAMFATQNILVQAVASVRRTRLLIYSSGFALGSNLALSFLLIPSFGLVGAAIGYSSVFGVTFAILYFFSKREGIIGLDTIGILKVWVASAVMFISVDLISNATGLHLIYLPGFIILGGLIYFGTARFLKIFGADKRDLILSMFPPQYYRLKKILSFLVLQ